MLNFHETKHIHNVFSQNYANPLNCFSMAQKMFPSFLDHPVYTAVITIDTYAFQLEDPIRFSLFGLIEDSCTTSLPLLARNRLSEQGVDIQGLGGARKTPDLKLE